jgi:hypothetical protein
MFGNTFYKYNYEMDKRRFFGSLYTSYYMKELLYGMLVQLSPFIYFLILLVLNYTS